MYIWKVKVHGDSRVQCTRSENDYRFNIWEKSRWDLGICEFFFFAKTDWEVFLLWRSARFCGILCLVKGGKKCGGYGGDSDVER